MSPRPLLDRLSLLRSRHGRDRIRWALARKANRCLRKIGFTLVAHHFYQPIPSDEEARTWAGRERPIEGVDWRFDRQVETVRDLFARFRDELVDPAALGAHGYGRERPQLGAGDAHLLYALVRDRKPLRVVEVGAGASTQILAAALERNHAETGKAGRLTTIEPFPSAAVERLAPTLQGFVHFELLARPLQRCDASIFQELGADDVLFVDSSHVYKPGSDVEHAFLQVYPRLAPGVLVHVHDVFVPFDYPQAWNLREHRFWNEQYVLEAFLQGNAGYEVVAALSMIAARRPEVLREGLPGFPARSRPGSFWMRRTGAP